MLRSEFLSAIVTRSTLTKVSSPFISISNYTLQPPLTLQSFSVNCSQLAPSSPSFLVRDKIVPKVVPKLSQSSLKVVQKMTLTSPNCQLKSSPSFLVPRSDGWTSARDECKPDVVPTFSSNKWALACARLVRYDILPMKGCKKLIGWIGHQEIASSGFP